MTTPGPTPDILTAAGRYFYFDGPSIGRHDIHEIAHALSNICRFTGHCREFYSVAQHSVIVSLLVPAPLALAGLLHDAAEAYVGDVSSPLKHMLPAYKAIEQRIEAVIAKCWDVDLHDPRVKAADLVALATEQRDLLPKTSTWKTLQGVEPHPNTITPLSPRDARTAFLDRYRELTGNRYEDF